MFKKSLMMCGVLVALVNCSKDNEQVAAKVVPSDTPTEYINSKGEVIDTVKPIEKPAPTADELTKGVWTEVGFGKDFLMEDLIGSDVCSIGAKQYVGCFYAAQELSEIVYGKDTILAVDGQINADLLGEKIQEMGPFAVYKKLALSDEKKTEAEKIENDFFKETVKAVAAVYEKEIASLTAVQESNERLLKVFPTIVKKIKDSARMQDQAALNLAQEELAKMLSELKEIKESLNKGVYKEYIALVDAAFEKLPAADRAEYSAKLYGTYLRHSADGHARVQLNPQIVAEISQQSGQPAESFFGVGMQVTSNKDGLFVEPFENSSAMNAGIIANDRIVSVNGEVVKDIEKAVSLIKGPRDSEVTITIERWGTKEQLTFKMKRQPVRVKSYEFSQKNINGKNYGVLKVSTFMDDEMANAVRAYIQKNDGAVEGWKLDLRGNGGGLLTQAVELLSAFLPQGSATVMQSADENPDVIDPTTMLKTEAPQSTEKNLVVLINERSASASEVVAGVLQEYKRALIVGTRSFGKGTVQQSNYSYHPDIPGYNIWDNFATMQMTAVGPRKVPLVVFWKTIGRYFFPSGRTPEWVGVEPDVHVLPNPEVAEVFAPREKDLIPFSFGNLGEPWVQGRTNLVTQIKTCVKTSGDAVKKWSTDEAGKPFGINYQTLFAFDALKCM